MSVAVMIAEAIAAGKLRRIPLGVAGLDPVTQRPWPSFEAALPSQSDGAIIVVMRLKVPLGT